MKKFFLSAIAVLTAFSCTSNKVSIKGMVEGTTEGDLVLKVLELNNQKVIDTIKIEDGKINYTLKLKDKSPNFYYLYYNRNKIASFVLLPGDKVKFSTDTLGTKTVVEGSEESVLLTELEKHINRVNTKFDSLVVVFNNAVTVGDTAKQRSVNYELGSLYVKHKQYSIKYLYTHPNSITNITLLYQKLPNNLPIFAEATDVLLFQRAYDSLTVAYPGSMYVSRLKDQIDYRSRSDEFSSRLLGASETGFPDITVPDMKANKRSLSEFSGKVIILSFWSVADVNQKMFNQDLLRLYDKYGSRGVEIFQVSVDTDKTAWANVVKDQMLPWVSVCDGLGVNSTAVKTYNITKVPALFVIDRNGNIVARDVYNSELERIVSGLAK